MTDTTAEHRSPLVSVVIPTYGRNDMLATAVGSVLSQPWRTLECIVVDDGSPEPIRRDSLPADDRLRLVRLAENGGPARARNVGVEQSSGEYVTFLDSDDWYVPDRFSSAMASIDRAPIVVSWQRYDHEVDKCSGRVLEGRVGSQILEGMTPSLGATIIHRSAWTPLRVDLLACQDVEWWLRTASAFDVTTDPNIALVVRLHDGARKGNGPIERVRHGLGILADPALQRLLSRRARAFRLFRAALTARAFGDIVLARRLLLASLRLHPRPRNLYHLLRTRGRATSSMGIDAALVHAAIHGPHVGGSSTGATGS